MTTAAATPAAALAPAECSQRPMPIQMYQHLPCAYSQGAGSELARPSTASTFVRLQLHRQPSVGGSQVRSRRLTAVEKEAPRYPRVSPKTKRVLGWGLTGIWLGGTTYLLEELHTGLWGPVALLAAVGAAELAFGRWNNGHWPGSDSTNT